MSKLFKKLFCLDENITVIESKDNKNQIKSKDNSKIQIQTKDITIPNLEEDPFFFT